MQDTSASLLDRLRDDPDEASWRELVSLYTPLIRGWLRRYAARADDADDVVQEVLAVLTRKLPDFRKEPRPGAFRRWLRAITVNCLRAHWRRQRAHPPGTGDSDVARALTELENPDSGLSRLWDEEHDRHVTAALLELIQPRFADTTWQAFRRVALDGIPPTDVASELGLTVNAVFIAKSRVMTALRQEGRGLLD
ncbi:MAG TPA: sigma-70 family RNA polymerase sigma factor [Gemmataceae bacterium]|nr:sigma-70 family RNA polymerase sigma factor [Gemmataceae bacterium]